MDKSKLIIAPGIPLSEVEALRKHIDEAEGDPDYDIIGQAALQHEREVQNFTAFKP